MRVDKSARSGVIIRISLVFYNIKICCMFSLESPHCCDSNEYTQYTVFNIKKIYQTKLSQICSQGIFFLGTQERVRNSRGNEPSVFEPLTFYCIFFCYCCLFNGNLEDHTCMLLVTVLFRMQIYRKYAQMKN